MSTATTTTTQQQTAPAATNPWEVEASSGGGGDFVACTPGNYPARIAAVIDLGHQPTNFKGEAKDVRQIVLVFELSKKQPGTNKPFVLATRDSFSMNVKANFRRTVQGVTGRTFADGERFDPTLLLGKPVMVNVTNSTAGEGEKQRTYHNVASVGPFPEGFPEPAFTLPVFAWSVNSVPREPFPDHDWLPYVYGSPIKDLAEGCREWRRAAAGVQPPASDTNGDDGLPY